MCNNSKQLIESKKGNIGALCGLLKAPKNIIHKDWLYNQVIDLSEFNVTTSVILYYYFNDIKSPLLCTYCDNHLKYQSFKEGFRKTCGNKECYVKHRAQTNLAKYGEDNPMKVSAVKAKMMCTNLERYGTKHAAQSTYIKEKTIQNNLEKYGVEYPVLTKEVQNKTRYSWYEKSDEYKD